MYLADTPTKIIRCYDYDIDSAELSGERTFAALQGPGSPDGSTADSDGCLWNAEWGGRRVVRYTPDGLVDRVVDLPCSQVSCCAFGDAKLDRLFVTTARTGLDSAALAREPLAGALFAVDVGVRGLAVSRCASSVSGLMAMVRSAPNRTRDRPAGAYRLARTSPCSGRRMPLAGRDAAGPSGRISRASLLTGMNSARSCEQISLTSPAARRASSRKRA
jgi:L-arabinonolactonase